METDEDHATMVQNILFIEYTDVFPAHVSENMVEKLWKADAIWFGFLIAYFGGNLWCPYGCIQFLSDSSPIIVYAYHSLTE